MLKEILGGNVCPVRPKHRAVYPIPDKLGFLLQVLIRRKLQKRGERSTFRFSPLLNVHKSV